jgi:uncharacterized membrane protein
MVSFPILLKTAGTLLFLDLFFLFTGGIFFRHMVERIQARVVEIRFMAAIPVYFAMAYLLLQTKSYTEAGIYGLCVYTVYEMTNYAIFKDYDLKIALMDMGWGAILFMFARYVLKHVL